MTGLEIILIAVVWIAYGVFSMYQIFDNDFNDFDDADYFTLIMGVALAPFMLLTRIIIGIFSNKVFK